MREKEANNHRVFEIKDSLSDAISKLGVQTSMAQNYRRQNEELLRERTTLKMKIDRLDETIDLLRDE